MSPDELREFDWIFGTVNLNICSYIVQIAASVTNFFPIVVAGLNFSRTVTLAITGQSSYGSHLTTESQLTV